MITEKKRVTEANESVWKRLGGWRWVLLAALASTCCVPVTFVAMVSKIKPWALDGPSMSPAYQNGDLMSVDGMAYGYWFPWVETRLGGHGTPALGDVVVMKSPMDEAWIVKRIVGLPGDEIMVRAGYVYRNGEQVTRTPAGTLYENGVAQDTRCIEESLGSVRYATLEDPLRQNPESDAVVVPAGYVYVLGDNRTTSNDSRRFGSVPLENIRARVESVARPGSRSLECR